MERPTIRVVRGETDQAFREATCTIEKIRESPQGATPSEKYPCNDDQDCHLVDSDSSVELDCLQSTDFSAGSQQQAGKAPRTEESGIGKSDSPAFTAGHLQDPTTTTTKALRHSTNASRNQPSNLRYRYTANQSAPASKASQTPQTLEPDLSRLKRAVGLNDHDYSYPQQLWRQRSTRPLTPTRSQALAYMSLSDARPWPMEVPRLEKDVDGEPEPLVRIREIEARRATMFSVTDSMAVEVDSSSEGSSSDDEDEKPKKNKIKANKLRKPPPTAAPLCCIGAGDPCIAKKFWRWARGLPTSPSSPESACSSCRSSISTQLTHEEIARRIKREVWDWTPEKSSLSASPSSSSSSSKPDDQEHEQVEEWIPLARQRPANPHPDHPRWRFLASRRVRVSPRKLSGRLTPPERVRVVCMPCIEECREEEEEEDDESEQVECDGSERFDGGDVDGPEAGVVKTERVDGLLANGEVSGDSLSSEAETEIESMNSSFDLDNAVSKQACAVEIKKVDLSDSQRAELERLRKEELEREKRDSLEPTLGSGTPPPVPPHREGSLREFQQKIFDFLMGELKALERRRGGVVSSTA